MADLIQEQATTYTPGENDLVYNTVVTMGSYSSPQPVVIKQYDSLPIIAAKMRKDGNDYQVPDGAAVNIRLHKRSGTFIYSSVKGISQDRKTAYIQLTSNMTAVYGRTMPCLEIVVNGSVACTGDMVWDIQRNPVQEDDVKDTSEGQYIQEMAAQVQAFEDTYQEALDYMNDATNQSRINNAASNAQAAQQAATNAANSADEAEEEANRAASESAKALGFRSFHGGQVVPGATDGDLDPSRPMSTPTAASVTIKARGDRIAGLTMAGKTTQAGTGDPSPENIRQISGVGQYDQCIVLDGSEDETWAVNSKGGSGPNAYYAQFFLPSGYPGLPFDANTEGNHTASSYVPGAATGNYVFQGNTGICCFTASGNTRLNLSFSGIPSSVSGLRTYLQQHPLTVWYRSVDFYKSTGPFYTVVELSQDPYRAVGFELNQPLFDGDSLKVGGLSGFDQMVVLDGESVDVNYDRTTETCYVGLPGNYPTFSSLVNGIASNSLVVYYGSNHLTSNKSIPGMYVFQSDGVKGINFRFDSSVEKSAAAYKSYLSAHPLIVFYKSVNYTEENDIPVALESHVMGYKVVTGTETITQDSSGTTDGYDSAYTVPCLNPVRNTLNLVCSQYEPANTRPNSGNIGVRTALSSDSLIFEDAKNLTSLAATKSYFAAQYAAGTPVQVVYELATPASYARPVPTMIAPPGEDGTFTVTGENSLSVLLKAFQDGGNAARLEGHTWDDIMAAIDQKIASLASTVMEVN